MEAPAISDQRTIFVTGAGSGIGRATARLFAERGWLAGLYDVDEASVARLADELGPERAVHGRLDVTDYEACRAALAAFGERAGGRLDCLFACAGILRMGPFADTPITEHRRTFEVNVLGVVHSIHAAMDLLSATPGAHVVSMGSASGLYGVPDLATYSASKFAVRGLTEALDIELARRGITVCDLMPSYVDTPLIRDQTYDAASVERMGVHLEPRQIAELVWRAAHGRKLHWKPTLRLKLLDLAGRWLPFLQRPLMRRISGY